MTIGGSNFSNRTCGAMIIVSLLVSACKKEDLIPLGASSVVNLSYVNVEARVCTSPRTVSKQKIKYLFIADRSASNQPGFPNPLTPNDVSNTDPVGARRYGPMVQFVNNLVPDPNNLLSFSLINFNDLAQKAIHRTTGQPIPGFIDDQVDFVENYVKPVWIGSGTANDPAPIDSGFTDYKKALELAYAMIKDDAEDEARLQIGQPIKIAYRVIFASDGIPTIPTTPGSANPTYTQTFLDDVSPVISRIINLKSDPIVSEFIGDISLNTAYYVNNVSIPEAETLLQEMADTGNGQFFKFTSGQPIAYQAFAPPARNIKNNLADIWVDNANVVSGDDGVLSLDSDGDFIPNNIEYKLGSNPFEADSDFNGVRDGVEKITKGVPCNDSKCSMSGRDPYSVCDGLSPSNVNGRITFPASSNDGLNDCEKFVLGANRFTFDSNSDSITDAMSAKNAIPLIAGTNGAFLNPFGDSLNNYEKLKSGYPTQVSEKDVRGFIPRTSTLIQVESDSPEVDCFKLDVRNVAVMQVGNVLKVYFIQNSSVIDNKSVLFVGSKVWNGIDTTVRFSEQDFR